jgi:glycosyltransferase involved in cell wall biosynthesis
MKVAAIIPALNAAKTIAPVVTGTLAEIQPVVVIDDGSSDETGRVATAAGAIVLRHPFNRGKGGALKTGFAWALQKSLDGVITLDADGQHLPHQIPKFLQAHEESGADLIIGGRSQLFHGMLPRRRMANRFSAWTIAKASGTVVTDSQSGFRFYSAKLIAGLHLRADGFDMESEVIVRAGRARLKILTIPIELGFVNGVSTSHYKPVKDTVRIAWTVIRTRLFG